MHGHRHFDEPHPFALETATEHYAADRPVKVLHLKLEVGLDFDRQSLSGRCTTRFVTVRKVSTLTFDAVEMEIEHAKVGGRRVEHSTDGKRLHLLLDRPLEAGLEAEAVITYRCTPRRGLYFIAPDEAYPGRPLQAWTQGQDEDSRHWYPCFDAPAQKATSEVIATFPKHMVALSNGQKVHDTVAGNKRTTHYRLDRPHAPYLVTLVVGEFDEHVERIGKTSCRTLFPPGKKADALRCVGRTPQMVKFFSDFTGQVYPWGDYAQVFVAEFIFGGMENTGATTLTDQVLHDARAALDYSAESLISHELAHQWFGDLLTCRDWPHGWLNEGFATYSEVLWKEEADGLDEGDHQRKLDLDAYLEEVSSRYARAIVSRKFDEPIDLFDRHLYEKGALVLHELRTRLGTLDFTRTVQLYVAKHRDGSVETVDLARAVEEATGKNFDRFFDQYVHRAGHPKLEVKASWDSEHQRVVLKVKQKAAGPDEKALWALPLQVRLSIGGQPRDEKLKIENAEHTFYLDANREPDWLLVDPRRDLLATVDAQVPPAWARRALLQAPVARARTEAAVFLGKDGSRESLDALGKVLGDEKAFWGTRAACARALGVARTPHALALLTAALKVKHPKARRAVVAALGTFRDSPEAEKVIARVVDQGDKSLFVEAEAARALGRLRAKTALPLLKKALKRDSFSDVIASAALDGLAELQDPKGFQIALDAARYGERAIARRAALLATAKLAEVAEKKTEAVDRLTQALRDPAFRVQLAAIDAAGTLGDARLIGPLSSTPFLDGRTQRAAREAIRTIRAHGPAPKELSNLRTEVDTLKGELKELKERFEASAAAAKKKQKK